MNWVAAGDRPALVRQSVWYAFITMGFLAAVGAHVFRPSDTLVAVSFIGVEACATAVAFYGAFRLAEDRLPALMVALGLLSNVLGEVVWYTVVVGQESTDVSLADAGWLLAYFFLASALWATLVRSQKDGRADLDTVVDALTIVVVAVLILWNLSIDAIAGDPSLTPTIKVVWSIYPIADAILIALVVRIFTNRRARSAMDPWFGVGVVCWLAADLGFLMLDLTDFNEAWENTGWMLGAILMARFARGSRLPRDEEHEGRELENSLVKIAIAILPLLVPPGLVLVDVWIGLGVQPVQLGIGMFILAVLAFVRTARLIHSERLARAELAAARDAALEGSRAKSAFLATMSHEIRTPMNGVIGLTGLMLNTELDERQRQYAEGVRGAGEALLALINDILDFSKVEAGKLELEIIDFNVVQVVEEAAELVAEAAQNKRLELLAYSSPELPQMLRGDPSRLRQVLLNLASNAIKFTASGEVVVRAQLEDRTDEGVVARFEVTDTGVGIKDVDAERLFEAFSQADSSTTRRYGGTGLGLAICRQLVNAMGGEIGVESEVGRGSTFWFTLPLALSSAEPAPKPNAGSLAGLKVLAVDDNRTNRLILGEQLGAWDIAVDTVPDGRTALGLLEAAAEEGTPYGLVVLDMCMPEMDGLQLAQAISASPRLGGTGMVLLTSSPEASPEEIRAAGIGASLTKPVHLDRLHAALREVLGATRTESRPKPERPVRRPGDSKGHILVVEDSPTNQLVAVGMLEHLGYTCEVAGNGLEAVAALMRQTFDAVLMDCQMPELDGYGATQEIRIREGDGPRTPIIAMTAGAVEGDIERCLEAGMDDYLAKPVAIKLLDSTLVRWVGAVTDLV